MSPSHRFGSVGEKPAKVNGSVSSYAHQLHHIKENISGRDGPLMF